MLINLGCGEDIMSNCINVDCTKYEGVNVVANLNHYPLPFSDGSADGIYASHIIEHIKNQKAFIYECYRILKYGGFLTLKVPHSSSAQAVGCMGHYRTYSYNTLKDYLSRDFYMFKTTKFKTVKQKLNWWPERIDNKAFDNNIQFYIIIMANAVISFLANLSPRLCENLWCYWVGGFREVIWKGEKV